MRINILAFGLIIISLLFQNSTAIAGKQKFTIEDAMKFKTLSSGSSISDDGNWAAYCVSMDRGNPTAYLQSLKDSVKFTIEKGSRVIIAKKSNFAAITLKPDAIETENLKPSDDKLKNGMALINLQTGKLKKFENIGSYLFSNDSKWIAYKVDAPKAKDAKDSKDEKNKKKILGSLCILRHLESGTEINISNVNEFQFDTLSKYFFYIVSEKNGKNDGVYFRDLNQNFCPETVIHSTENTLYGNICWNMQNNILAYTSSKLENNGDPKETILKFFYMESKLMENAILADKTPKGWFIPYTNTLKWSEDGQRLFFGFKPVLEKYSEDKPESKYSDSNFYNIDTILKRTTLQIWHSKDLTINSNQKTTWKQHKDKIYNAVYHLKGQNFVQLADSACDDVLTVDNPDYTIGRADLPFRRESTWNTNFSDLYLISLKDGKRKKIATHIKEEYSTISPHGKFVAYFAKKQWMMYHIEDDTTVTATKLCVNAFWDEDNDVPNEAPPYGYLGWMDDDLSFFVYDKYDVWRLYNDKGGTLLSLSGADGRSYKHIIRIANLEPDKKYFTEKDTMLVVAFNEEKKDFSFYYVEPKVLGVAPLLELKGVRVNPVAYSKGTKKILFTKEAYDTIPELWVTNFSFKDVRQLTNLNEQLDNFNWGKTEHISWKSPGYKELEGYIIKPGNYDPKKRYPVITYYYERYSDRLNYWVNPYIGHRPCFPIYSDDGYVIFVPDIRYHAGRPGYDAVDALVSGAKKLVEMGIADSNAIGLIGHSWSGYQTSFAITQTNYFKAAVAGAPVGNMTSAYSGIRLESGLARQFQYEREQSRIGGNLWDSLQAYIKNSPVFQAQGVKTPLLIMFGDEDPMVPWQQGIELYLAMRRLNKDCIFLQYEKEPHWPNKYYNRIDYAIKMKQFFDAHLKNAEQPDWMKNGKPYKGE
ncbi:MAG: prolyl oligopeptidase family serine peptidase [Candidatus Kapabacteria bacterium]|nr:prolyl oligopeptidase family serine peptidase [Candidatus Kapabacteria bacterium]